MKKYYFLLTAGGIDSKGIIHQLSGILTKYGYNIEDSSMLMLRKTFSVIVLLSGDENLQGLTAKKFKNDIKHFAQKHCMSIDLKHICENDMKEYSMEGDLYMISISGADRPGIVKKITGILYKQSINVIDMETKSSQNTIPPAYYMFLEVDIPRSVKMNILKKILKAESSKIGVHITINKLESNVL